MFRPKYVFFKKNRLFFEFIPWIFPYFDEEIKRFVCSVIVENSERMVCGAGTITPVGIITAAHLFSFPFSDASATIFIDDCRIATIPIKDVILNVESDLAFCQIITPKYLNPCNLPPPNVENVGEIIVAFGCPQAVFGKSWRPRIINKDEKYIITQGVVIPGISGGGIYAKDTSTGKYYLLAVNSFGYLDSKTLYSIRL